MKKTYLLCGKIVGAHGVRGEVKLLPYCDSPSFLNNIKKFYFSQNENDFKNAASVRAHQNVSLIKFEDVNDMDAALALRDKKIYIKREDCRLSDGQFFIEELIGCEVFDKRTGKKLGHLCEVSTNKANDVWHIKADGKEYLVPYIPPIQATVDIENNRIEIIPLDGIFENED